jgi:hypothetical protein
MKLKPIQQSAVVCSDGCALKGITQQPYNSLT